MSNDFITECLEKIGITPRLLSATEDHIPEAIRHLLPALEELGTGFGLPGTSGAGKSCAVVCYARRMVERDRNEWLASLGGKNPNDAFRWDTNFVLKEPNRKYCWLNWHDAAQKIQECVYSGLPSGTPPRWHPLRIQRIPVLILDDIGREKVPADGFAAGHFESIIDYRYEHGLTTIWTSNLTIQDLINRYHIATMDRLRALAPFYGSKEIDLRSLR